jgi:hypothetical protein
MNMKRMAECIGILRAEFPDPGPHPTPLRGTPMRGNSAAELMLAEALATPSLRREQIEATVAAVLVSRFGPAQAESIANGIGRAVWMKGRDHA